MTVLAVRDVTNFTVSGNNDWVDLPGSETAVNMARPGALLARFTAFARVVTNCGPVVARILVDGVEMEPAAGMSTSFDGAIERSSNPLGSGLHSVKVQVACPGFPSNQYFVEDWHFTAEVLR
jgi:hypothetical protein